MSARRLGKLRLGDLAKLTASVKKLLHFIVTPDWRPGKLTDSADLRVTPKGAKILRDARGRLFELDGVLEQRLPDVAASLDGIRAGIV